MNANRENGEARARWVEDQLSALDAQAPDWNSADVEGAWRRMRSRMQTPPARLAWRWVSVGAVIALAGALGLIPSARAAGGRMLSLFRVTHVTALPLDLNGNAPIAERSTSAMIGNLLSDDLTVTRNEKTQSASSAGAAAQLAGFQLRVPADASAQYRVQGEKDFQLIVDRARAQSLLDSAGVVGEVLSPDLDGATIAVHIPRAVHVSLGDCSTAELRTRRGLPLAPTGAGCTVLVESPSPTVSLPPGLDMQKVAEVGLQLLGMSAEEARQYCQTVDWRSTLVVPVPRGQAQSRNVSVDGVQGILLTRERQQEGGHYVLLWSRQGMLYSIAGSGDGSQGLTLAAELPPS